ncbi:MAG: cation:proton antiporter [Sneathiella sp.]|uniref:cation:proton antiporter n=1 Tax=Sneathiella sp. TaxID=1964365 RepID=UPI003002C6BB
MTMGLLILSVFTAAFAMIAKRLTMTVITAPMMFIAFGLLLSKTDLFTHGEAEEILHLVAEVALVVLLFLDAAQIDLSALRKRHVWPTRMLVIGLPLAIALGVVAFWVLLPGWSIFAIALLAAILAPTDAALGQVVVTNSMVPERSRRALTVESGLNDGLALPAILLFACFTAEAIDPNETNWAVFGAKQLILGPVIGIIVGYVGGRALLIAKKKKLTADTFEGIGAIALAGAAYLGATQIGGNGFIAAFAGGLVFGNVVKGQCKFVYEFMESEGQFLTWGAFFLLGLALMPEALHLFNWQTLAVVMVSLLVIRPLAIWVSLIGTDASTITRIFFGWFGPRGLATALFALLVVPTIDHEYAEPILSLAINTVWISALLHGFTALPGAKLYAAYLKKIGPCAETEPIETSAKPLITK